MTTAPVLDRQFDGAAQIAAGQPPMFLVRMTCSFGQFQRTTHKRQFLDQFAKQSFLGRQISVEPHLQL